MDFRYLINENGDKEIMAVLYQNGHDVDEKGPP
jgi:hypothetical protein